MADTATRCLKCGRFAGKKANFCPSCGNDLRAEARLAAEVDAAFSEETRQFLDQIDEIDATEIISVIRRPDETITVDLGDVDPDVALSLMIRGIVIGVLGDMEMVDDDDLEDDGEN